MGVTAEETRTPEQIAEDERQQRLTELAQRTRLQPVGPPSEAQLAGPKPNLPARKTVDAGPAPRLQPVSADDDMHSGDLAQPTRLKPLAFADRQRLPVISPGAEAGSSGQDRSEIARFEDQKANPWGSKDNHPGVLGRLGHIAARVGNIAGDIFAPATMALIPGTDLNRNLEEQRSKENLETDEGKDLAARKQKTDEEKESSEEDLRAAQTKNFQNKDSEVLAAHGLIRDPDSGVVSADMNSPITKKTEYANQALQHSMALHDAQKDLADARADVERAKGDPNSPQYKIAYAKMAMAQRAHDIAERNLSLHLEQFGQATEKWQNKQQEQGLIKPGGQAQSRGSAAAAVLNVIPDLEELINKNRDSIGPIMGRLAKGELAIGDVDPGIAELYTAMKSFYALQPAVHGFKNHEFVKDFESAMGTLERDPDAFLAGMHGLIPTLKAVQAEGVTFHKRVVEGGEPGKPAANAGGGAPKALPADLPAAPAQDGHEIRDKATKQVIAVSKGGKWQLLQ